MRYTRVGGTGRLRPCSSTQKLFGRPSQFAVGFSLQESHAFSGPVLRLFLMFEL